MGRMRADPDVEYFLFADRTVSLSEIETIPRLEVGNTFSSTSMVSVYGSLDASMAGHTIQILDGATIVGTATVLSNGTWATSLTLADGTHTLIAYDTQSPLGVQGYSNVGTVTVDTVPLFGTITSIGGLTYTSIVSLNGTGKPGAIVQIYGFTGPTIPPNPGIGSATVGSDGLWSTSVVLPTLNLDNGIGNHALSAVFFGQDPNYYVAAPQTVTFDYELPPIPLAPSITTVTPGGFVCQ